MSSRYNIVELDDIPLPEFDGDPNDVEWQSKTFDDAFCLERVRITADGRLLREDARYEEVPLEDRPHPDEYPMLGSMNKVTEGWTDAEYHGIFHFYASVDDEWYAYDAKFTDGDLEAIERVDRDR